MVENHDMDDELDMSIELEDGELKIKEKTDDRGKKGKRLSRTQWDILDREQKEELLDEAVGRMQQCMQQMIQDTGFFETAQKLQKQLEDGTYSRTGKDKVAIPVDSEITIYKNAVRNGMNNRGSSSSEEWVDTSDENLELLYFNQVDLDAEMVVDPNELNKDSGAQEKTIQCEVSIIDIENFIAERRREADMVKDGPSTSDGNARDKSMHKQQINTAEERAKEMIREADAAKATAAKLKGKNLQLNSFEHKSSFVRSALVDENCLIMAAHVDEVTQYKIEKGEYVDFA